MAVLLDAIERVLAQGGKRVVRYADRGGTIMMEACSAVRAAPCPDTVLRELRRALSFVEFRPSAAAGISRSCLMGSDDLGPSPMPPATWS